MTSISTPVWRLTGLRGSEPGTLQLSDGRLKYTPDDGPGFDVPMEEISGVNFPWYYFSGGFKLRVRGEEYRFSFVEPHNEYADIKSGRSLGKQWKAALGQR
ncbi:MAG: hypothetical protein IPM25_16035 [Chloracidobacterium sp.]|nr:hypothetical protein [Chloracidobacterium sp.]